MFTEVEVSIIKGLLARGEKQQDIAAFFGCNGGRIAEINTGQSFPDVVPAPKKDLPTSAGMSGGYVVHQCRMALRRATLGIQSALAYLDDYEQSLEKKS